MLASIAKLMGMRFSALDLKIQAATGVAIALADVIGTTCSNVYHALNGIRTVLEVRHVGVVSLLVSIASSGTGTMIRPREQEWIDSS